MHCTPTLNTIHTTFSFEIIAEKAFALYTLSDRERIVLIYTPTYTHRAEVHCANKSVLV